MYKALSCGFISAPERIRYRGRVTPPPGRTACSKLDEKNGWLMSAGSSRRRQGLTLVHYSAQPEPFVPETHQLLPQKVLTVS